EQHADPQVLPEQKEFAALEKQIPFAPVAPAGQHVAPEILAAHNAWIKESKEIMTTSSTNNSVFRGFFEKQKLSGPNFIDWYRQLRIVLSIEDKLNYLEQPIPPAPVAPAGQQVASEILAAYNAWIKGSKEITGLMLMTMEPEIQQNLEPLHAHEMLKEQEEGQSVCSYVLKMKGYIDYLERLGYPVTLGLGTVNELHAMLKLHEQTLPKRNALALHAIRAGKVQKEIRHWKRNCPQYIAELMKKKKNAASGAGGSGVITVSRLYEDGFVNRFVDNIIHVSRNNVVYFSAILRDGIFEIDLSNSLTNESSIYVVSNKRAKLDLDSALLWHCRLGHISKKRIEKLKHDGLLDSSDLRAFENVSLIYVCGPFKIMSRQGASYFVTFIDDFSRYGYVYLLKHKHEVFETFKVFQKEVENPLGYPKETMRYSFYYPPENKVLVAWNAEFLGNSLIDQEASGSLEDLEIIQEEDTHPSLDTSLNHEEDDLEIDESQSDIVPIRRYTRTRHDPDRMCLYIDAEEHKLGDLDNEVWVLVELPPNGKTIGSKWLFKKTTDMDGNVHIYKAHLVAKGYTQTPGIDYEETFSPVADIRAISILIAIAAYYDYKIWQMDVKTAFVNGYLNEEVYMEQPEGFVNKKYPNRVCKLKRSIYGLKQASRQW
nr:hypothetical protein [Tanacetum cinerariifolium]